MRPYMKAEEVAVELGVSIGTVYNYRSDGLLHQVPVGRKKYFQRDEVLSLKEKLAAAGVVAVKHEVANAAA